MAIKAEDIPLVAETDEYLVVNKPIGIASQGEVDSLLMLLKDQQPDKNFYPVHRLDKVTSGCLVLAKSTVANRTLSLAFAEGRVEKYYVALTHKKPKKKQGRILGDMARSRNGSYKLLRSRENPAKTSFFSYALGQGDRVLFIRLYTGKTHQARVALKSVGAPILGDRMYGGDVSDRVYLHCYKMVFFPGESNEIEVSCLPKFGEKFLTSSFLGRIAQIEEIRSLPWPE